MLITASTRVETQEEVSHGGGAAALHYGKESTNSFSSYPDIFLCGGGGGGMTAVSCGVCFTSEANVSVIAWSTIGLFLLHALTLVGGEHLVEKLVCHSL